MNRTRWMAEGLALLSASVVLAGAARQPRAAHAAAGSSGIEKLVGAWKRIGTVGTDGKFKPFVSDYTPIKFVAPTHFTWLLIDKNDHTTQAGFSGACDVQDQIYTEYVETGPEARNAAGAFLGKAKPGEAAVVVPFKFRCRVEGDRWYLTFASPSSETGIETGKSEVWQRLKPGERLAP